MAGPIFIQVPPNSTGEKLQAWQNTVNGQAVDTEAVCLTDTLGVQFGTSGNPLFTEPNGVVVQPVTLGASATQIGCSVYHLVSAGSNNANNIKASAGQVYGWSIFNNGAYPVYLKFFNETGTPNPASDTVIQTVGVQSGLSRDVFLSTGIPYGTGIGIAIVKGIADNNNTAILASDCVVDIYYL